MRKTLSTSSLLFIALAFIVSSCTKEGPEGPVGATGLPGVNGAPGSNGPAGPAGPAGAAGTANVIYSAWLATPTTFNAAGWFDSTISTIGVVSRANFPAPSLTQAIMNQGVVLVYHTFAASPALPTASANTQSLPFSVVAGADLAEANYRPAVGRLIVFIKNLTGTTGYGLTAGHYFRYVLIPGGVSGGRVASTATNSTYSIDELKGMSYNEVANLFQIPANGSNE